MTRLKPGDRIICKIKNSKIAHPQYSFDDEYVFEILVADDAGYYLHVPEYYNIKNMTEITQANYKKLDIPLKYVGSYVTYIFDTHVSSVHYILDGCMCAKCGEFYFYAAPNQENGTLICFTCRNYPIYKSSPDDDY
jgi:hypothetical protein